MSSRHNVSGRLAAWLERPAFSYVTITLLQLKIVWGAWLYRDLTPGDTSGYFNRGYMWFERWATDIAWSPLYTMFYGSLLHLSTHAYVVTILHRLLIVFALTLLVLALMRRLLPAGLAWLVAAWWAILPINFDALYELHLFAAVPILIAWVLFTYPSPWCRGSAFATVLTASFLVRNEFAVPSLALAVLCLALEIRERRRRGPATASVVPIACAYALPLLLGAVVVGFVYCRSVFRFPRLLPVLEQKHTENMCQVFAYGYRQRHPEWSHDPWTECYGLMESTFGSRLPSLTTMIRRNRRAVVEHFLWNIRLFPSGLQILLWNEASGDVNPDYAAATLRSPRALVLSVGAVFLVLAGTHRLARDHRFWWDQWFRVRAPAWAAILSTAALIAVVVIPTQRPRPSYLFSLSVALMGVIGTAVFVLTHRWIASRPAAALLAVIMVAAPLVAPSRYLEPSYPKRRLLLEIYDRLLPFAQMVGDPRTVLLASRYGDEAILYVGHNISTTGMRSFSYSVLADGPPGLPLRAALARRGVNLFYVDETIWADEELPPRYQRWVRRPDETGWKLLAYSAAAPYRWLLLRREGQSWYEDPLELLRANSHPDIAPTEDRDALQRTGVLPIDGLFLGRGWHDLEREQTGEGFRWVDNDAEIVSTLPSGGRRDLALVIEPGPGVGSQPFTLDVLDATQHKVASCRVQGRERITVGVPVDPHITSVYRLRTAGGGLRTRNDARILNFRVFRFGWV